MDKQHRELERKALEGDAAALKALWASNRRQNKGCPNCGCDILLDDLCGKLYNKTYEVAMQERILNPEIQSLQSALHKLIVGLKGKSLHSVCMGCGLLYVPEINLNLIKTTITEGHEALAQIVERAKK